MVLNGVPAHPGCASSGNSRCASLQLFFQKFDHIVKTAFIGLAHISQGLMSREDMLGLDFFAFGGGFTAVLQGGADLPALCFPHIAITVQIQNMIQAQAGEELQVALVGVDDAQ